MCFIDDDVGKLILIDQLDHIFMKLGVDCLFDHDKDNGRRVVGV